MKLLKEISEKSLGVDAAGDVLGESFKVRKSARGILFNDKGEVSLQFVSKFTFITGNKHKAAEYQAMLGDGFKVTSTKLDIKEVQSMNLEEVAMTKDLCPDDPLIRLLGDSDNRKGVAKVCIAYYEGGNSFVVSGEVSGTVTRQPRGESGFGFDSVFMPDGQSKTFAEMTMDEKNRISHRRRALEAFKVKIQTV